MTRTAAVGLVLGATLWLCGCPQQDELTDASESATPDGATPADTLVPADAGLDVAEEDTSGPAVECGGGPNPQAPFPAAELGVRITSPSGSRAMQYPSMSATLGGVLFGPAVTLAWASGDKSGEIAQVAGFWQAVVPLTLGDNRVTVTAADKDGIAVADTITLSVAPAPVSNLRLRALPEHLFAGETQTLKLTVDVPSGAVDAQQVNLWAVAKDGTPLAPPTVTKMRDDGVSVGEGRCDSVPGDRNFSVCHEETPTTPGQRCYRVRLQFSGGEVQTPTLCVDVLKRITQSECLDMEQAVSQVQAAYDGAGDHEQGLDLAKALALATGDGALVTAAGRAADGYGLWLQFSNGALGALPLGVPDGFRASVPDSRALLVRSRAKSDEIDTAGELLTPDSCPPFDRSGPHRGEAATLERLRGVGRFGVIAFSGHGGAFFGTLASDEQTRLGWRHLGTQEIFWAGEPVRCERLLDHAVDCAQNADCPTGSTCLLTGATQGTCSTELQADLARGRVLVGRGVYGITPAFVDHYGQGGLPNTIVYAGSCYSLWNGSMAMAFLASSGGTGTYVGYDGLVRDAFAQDMGATFFQGLKQDSKPAIDAACFAADPEFPTTRVRLAGASQLGLGNGELKNGQFELGGFQAWTAQGDARQVVSFCGDKALGGSFTALLGTGLGTSDTGGSIRQRFCIPAGTQTLSLTWRFYSSEFPIACGADGVQDRWKVTLQGDGAGPTIDVRDCDITDMCAYTALPGCAQFGPPPGYSKCGACYEPYTELAGCSFAGEPVWATESVVQTVNVAPLAGQGPVTLSLEVKSGHPTLETAVLLDDIRIQ